MRMRNRNLFFPRLYTCVMTMAGEIAGKQHAGRTAMSTNAAEVRSSEL